MYHQEGDDNMSMIIGFFNVLWGLLCMYVCFHVMGISLILEIINGKFLYMIVGILFSAVIILLDECIVCFVHWTYDNLSVKFRTKETKYYRVTGRIYNIKSNQCANSKYAFNGENLIVSKLLPKQTNIYIEYQDLTKIIDAQYLTKQYERGDSISLILVKKFDKDNKIISRTLELPE